MKKLSFTEHQEQQKKRGIIVLRDPSNTRRQEMDRRKQLNNDYQATLPELQKSELGKYIPAGRFKNV